MVRTGVEQTPVWARKDLERTYLNVLPGGPPLLQQDCLHVPLRDLEETTVAVGQVDQSQRQEILQREFSNLSFFLFETVLFIAVSSTHGS
jgi:hypothetical protein